MNEGLFNKLQSVPEFTGLPESQLQWLTDKGVTRKYADGDKVFLKNDKVEGLQIVLQGEIELKLEQGGNLRNLGSYVTGDLLGKLPYSRMTIARVEGTAHGDTELFFLHQDLFPEMINCCHALTEVLVHNMTDRARDFVKSQQQIDKMMALGKLSAGLAHELNNPSAAVVRSSQALKKHLSLIPENFKRVIKIQATDEHVDLLNDLVFGKIKNSAPLTLSLMQKTALEDDITEWLDKHGIQDAYDWVDTFLDYNLSVTELEQIKSWARREDLLPIIGWVAQVLTTEKLVNEIEEASKRINTLVTSVKAYTHMDQAPEKQKTDIHVGIHNTLTMLNHKAKKNNITITTDFQPDLPLANILVSEMNQVWTNLIDNAIDAMDGRPDSTLKISTRLDREAIQVLITDNGMGIPENIMDKIFDPFFTTKSVGKGTGIGLEIVNRIISEHRGKITVKSAPGNTTFEVCIPL